MGKIVLVSIPIGNIQDITFRAKQCLEKGTIFLVEDTRSFKKLALSLNISLEGKVLESFHDQSEPKRAAALLKKYHGQDLFVVSEAGSPYLSDPAYPLVQEALNKGVKVESTGGINAATYALELSGLAPNPFTFHGFITRNSGGRKRHFQKLSGGTHLFFEGVSRVMAFLKDFSEVHPESKVVVARELTKMHETIHRFKAQDFLEEEITLRGEFVIVTQVLADQSAPNMSGLLELAENVLKKKGKKKELSKLLGQILGKSTNDIYAELGDN